MSLIVTVWTTEGIVMGSDSRISFTSPLAPNVPFNIQTGHYFDVESYDKSFTDGYIDVPGKTISHNCILFM
ncbi:MAG: hypothetical protein IJX16_07010 [Clostridia bacterium]|nr:hypothetical protein [Clostridia bacterium]